MKVFVDTNIFIASTVDEPGRGDLASEFLNQDFEYCTTIFNTMEFRTVLAKKNGSSRNAWRNVSLTSSTRQMSISLPWTK
jgi:predicted nucleic acid-binding protein